MEAGPGTETPVDTGLAADDSKTRRRVRLALDRIAQRLMRALTALSAFVVILIALGLLHKAWPILAVKSLSDLLL